MRIPLNPLFVGTVLDRHETTLPVALTNILLAVLPTVTEATPLERTGSPLAEKRLTAARLLGDMRKRFDVVAFTYPWPVLLMVTVATLLALKRQLVRPALLP